MAAGTGFESGPVGGTPPFSFDYHARPPNDPFAIVDGEPLAKLTALHQRRADLFNQTPSAMEVKELRDAVAGHQVRIATITKSRGEGGPGLKEGAPQVREERRKLERAEAELSRVSMIKDTRGARSAVVGQLEKAVDDWLTGGIPGGCILEPVEDPPLSELLIKSDAGRLDTAVARYRQQVEAHAEALRVIQAAPFTKAEADALIARQINTLADAATPNVARVARFLEPVQFATTVSHRLAQNVDPKVPPTIVGNEAVDTLGTLCWLFRSELIDRLQGMVTEADGAVSQSDREVETARIGALLLECERRECAAIWAAEANGTTIDFRPGTSAQALLGVRLVTRPPTESGSSPEHAGFEIVGPQR